MRPVDFLHRNRTKEFQESVVHALQAPLSSSSCPVYDFKVAYQLREFLSKYSEVDAKSAEQRATAAIEKWRSVEVRNVRTNFRITYDSCDFGYATSNDILETARGYIAEIIGVEPPADLFSRGIFTNGASTGVKRSASAIADKFVGEADVSSSSTEYFLQYLEGVPVWKRLLAEGNLRLRNQEFSVMFTVPKNSEIDRVACKEPEINMYLQRACGIYFREQLKKRGRIDLQDQSVNRNLARLGSSGELDLATLDLSSASDTVTESLVFELLPPAWVVTLNDVRVKYTMVPGETKPTKLSMFSSMGNGFTFELESLIFFCLVRAVAYWSSIRGRISVYGDDIVCPNALAPRLVRVFAWFGFKVNPKKSFWTGRFRESCGGHYYRGYDVTPFYLKSPMLNQQDLINQLNQLREWILRDNDCGYWTYECGSSWMYSPLIEVWKSFAKFIRKDVWGGRDLESSSALVTPDMPRKRFINATKDVQVDQEGGYLHWLRVADGRILDAAENYVPGADWLRLSLATDSDQRGLVTSTVSVVAKARLANVPRPFTAWSLQPGELFYQELQPTLSDIFIGFDEFRQIMLNMA
jgi:hypothetical protein